MYKQYNNLKQQSLCDNFEKKSYMPNQKKIMTAVKFIRIYVKYIFFKSMIKRIIFLSNSYNPKINIIMHDYYR